MPPRPWPLLDSLGGWAASAEAEEERAAVAASVPAKMKYAFRRRRTEALKPLNEAENESGASPPLLLLLE